MAEVSTQIQLIYTTAENLAQAHRLGMQLVEEKLVGCVNILPVLESIYYWEGKIQSGQEVALLIKTTIERTDAAVARIQELHSYRCPAILILPANSANHDYTHWLQEQTETNIY